MQNVLIFDSGVGGLSISESLTTRLPNVRQLLLADNAFFPYGEMEESSLVTRVTGLLTESVSRLNPDCIVIACNTVSTVVLDQVRQSLNIPIIGVVPAIKPAAKVSNSKVIGLLATPATIKRTYTADLIAEHGKGCSFISVGSTRLVEMAELKLCGIELDHQELRQQLLPLIEARDNQQLDTLILGCTHFPLLTEEIAEIMSKSVTLVDSSQAIARQVESVLLGLEGIDYMVENSDSNQIQVREQEIPLTLNPCYMTKDFKDQRLNAGLNAHGFDEPQLF